MNGPKKQVPLFNGFSTRPAPSGLWVRPWLPSRVHSLLWLLLCGAAVLHPARASSIPYPLSSFASLNTNADGVAVSSNGGIAVTITGGNNGSGLTGSTDLFTTATAGGTIAFHYVYASMDEPGFDWAGYFVGDQFTQVADTDGETGSASFAVALGDVFGFRVVTFDNTQEPGVFTVSDFSQNSTGAGAGAGAGVPEPYTVTLVAAALAVTFALARRRSIPSTQENQR